jgi:hypothetical protein
MSFWKHVTEAARVLNPLAGASNDSSGGIVETTYESNPTAGVGDDGGDWEYSIRNGRWERAVRTTPPPDPENWIEHMPGRWHRK